jgi:FkbM family methyltransferase
MKNARVKGARMLRALLVLVLTAVAASAAPRIITAPEDVALLEPEYATEHWGRVDFPPVPAYYMDTLDPDLQDTYVSAWVHTGLRPWDEYIWDRVAALSQEQRDSNVFVDVGANLGYFTLAAASLGYDVVAFEPMSRNARKLSRSILRNNYSEYVLLYQNAVTNASDDTVTLAATDASSNQGNGQITSAAGGESAPTVTLSDLFSQGTHATDAHIVKIDTEGMEAAVLLGARHWICSGKVRHIILEFSEATRANAEYPAADMFAFMQRAGYTLFDVALGTEPIPYDALTAGVFGHVPPNLLFSLSGETSTCTE